MRPLRSILAATGVSVLLAAMTASASFADDGSFNNVNLTITGGNARALAACVNVAKAQARTGHFRQVNFCKNVATATGGTVNIANVSILIVQTPSDPAVSRNRVNITISGGDATAVAACENILHGNIDPAQVNACKNTATATGGDVNLDDVDITILQGP